MKVKHTRTFIESARKLNFTNHENWLWDIDDTKLTDAELRTACLYEYVRETKYLLDITKKTDSKMVEAGWKPTDCRNYLNGEKFARLTASGSCTSQLCNALEQLALAIYPLSPHVLLGKDIENTPFFSLNKRNLGKDDYLPDVNDAPPQSQTIPAKRNFAPGYQVAKGMHWLYQVGNIPGSVETRVQPPGFAGCISNGYLNFKCRPFDNTNGLIVDEASFKAQNSLLFAELIANPDMRIPDGLSPQVQRLSAETAFVDDELELSFDPKYNKSNAGHFVIFAKFFNEPGLNRSNPGDLAEMIYHEATRDRTLPTESILKGATRIFPFKPNSTYYKTALATLSAIRMGVSITPTQFNKLDAIKNNWIDAGIKPTIPYISRQTIQNLSDRCEKLTSEMFPTLTKEQRKLKSLGTSWTFWSEATCQLVTQKMEGEERRVGIFAEGTGGIGKRAPVRGSI